MCKMTRNFRSQMSISYKQSKILMELRKATYLSLRSAISQVSQLSLKDQPTYDWTNLTISLLNEYIAFRNEGTGLNDYKHTKYFCYPWAINW